MLQILHHASSLYHSITHLRHTYQDAHYEMTTSSVFNRAVETVESLRLKLPEELSRPRVAIVCGSGLGGLKECVNKDEKFEEGKTEWEYKDVVNFPMSTGMYNVSTTWTDSRYLPIRIEGDGMSKWQGTSC